MAYSYTSLLMQRLLLPIVLVLAALFRPVGISFVYLLMFFVSPFIPVATHRNFKSTVTPFMIILIAQSSLLILCHIVLQVVIISFKMDDVFGKCLFTEQLLRHVGFIDLRNLHPLPIVEWLIPEVVVFATSLTVYLVTKRLVKPVPDPSDVETGDGDVVTLPEDQSDQNVRGSAARIKTIALPTEPSFHGFIKVSPHLCMTVLFFAAVLRPSVPGGLYFLIFLLTGTYWATTRSLGRIFSVIIRLIMFVIVLHILAVVAYQCPWMQQHLDKSNLVARLIGLEALVKSSCEHNYDIRIIIYDTETYNIESYFNPLVLCIAFYTLALSAKNFNQGPLVRNVERSNVEISDEGANNRPITASDINLESLVENELEEAETQTSVFDQISYGFVSVGSFIYQNSYIFTNILMMAWSIIYHSWLTFVLLLWANLLWMIPNQRKSMLSSSPFIVLYAELLLLAQYIYGMNLNDDELPSKVDITGINLAQIGFTRPLVPCVPLIVKSLFLLMFWVSLRQFLKEKKEIPQNSTIIDIFAPLNFGTSNNSKKTSMVLKKLGEVIKNLLVRLWIWLLVLVIFLCAITGKNMTGFRICYMALFLFFLLVFQSSSKAWLNIMYGFWLFLIFYVMSILILIYTYQFDKFDIYWNNYLHVSDTLQHDIGLERYQTKDLFLHLLPPTLIVILTVIQVHYFHKRFIEGLQKRHIEEDSIRPKTHSAHQNAQQDESITDENIKKPFLDLLKIFLRKVKYYAFWIFKNFKDIVWRFLELNLLKLVYLTGFICSVSEVCVIHIVFVVLCIVGVSSQTLVQVFISRIISLIVSIIVLMKMIYQVTYLDHHDFDTNCTESGVVNDAVWFGLKKASPETDGLMSLIRLYIVYMVMVTLHAVVTLRQFHMRSRTTLPTEKPPLVLFPNVTRKDAEVNLNKMIKYLLNYGYYKFGLEISIIWLLSTISYRQDLVALLYSVWFTILLLMKRRQIARIWVFFGWFIGISIVVQYIVLVGLPPNLCMNYPWDKTLYSLGIQRWTMLPTGGPKKLEHVSKLIFDFVLLMFISRQQNVFKIESAYNNPNASPYPGGSNTSVVKDIAKLGQVPFENPTRDFLSHVRNYLDVFNNIVFSGFYWTTLAVIFVGGTNIRNFLALGYLIGAFVFLWEGSDFYLRPIASILKRWKWLIAYNVANIMIKTVLQIGACIFLSELQINCCWLVHLLGISCEARPYIKLNPTDPKVDCPESTMESSLSWDTICFAFLIFQMRIFKSHYFCHLILDTRANNLLASRGAEIIEDLRQKQIHHRQQHEKEILLKIKRKMEKIRATQQKMLRPIDKPTHFDESGNLVPASRPHRRKPPKLHPEAVRAGDYYMFDDVDEKFELDIIEDGKDFLDEQEQLSESDKKMTRRKTILDQEPRKSDMPKHRDSTGSTVSKKEEQDEKDDEQFEDTRVVYTQTDEFDHPSEDHSKKSEDKTPKPKDTEDEDLTANPILRLIEGFLVSLIIRLNRFSRNYRYVNKILSEEKRILKESRKLTRFSRPGAASMFGVFKKNVESSLNGETAEANMATSQNDITQLTAITPNESNLPSQQDSAQDQQQLEQQQQQQSQQQLQQIEHADHDIIELPLNTVDAGVTVYSFDDAEFASRDHNIMIKVLISLWYAILSNTDLICYIVIFISQICNASIISLPLPMMVFLWGAISLPRPTKTFWVTLIAYTQAIVLIKCIFQYKLIWANYINLPNQPLGWAKILGVEESENYAIIDLLVLLILFFHRFILKTQGLWKSKYSLSGSQENMSDADNRGAMVKLDKPEGGTEPEEWRDTVSNAERLSAIESDHSKEIAKVDSDNERQRGGMEIQAQKSSAERDSEGKTLTDKYLSGLQRLGPDKYLSSLQKFFYNLVYRPRLPDDVYALMFLCDFINFFVLLFGFSSFSSRQTEKDEGVQAYLSENKVPIPFLIMLLVQFLLIVIDRALYLRKALIPKIVFHFISVVGIHIWMFFVVPYVTERSFYKLAPPIIFYIFKCFYMLLSSYQIKCGYPRRILGNFLTKGFSIANMISFKVFMAMPFLYELRTILDWLCTDTTMTLFDWLKMEDIFSDIFVIRCTRQLEKDFPAIRAEKKALPSKLFLGGTIILIIVTLIWGPLCIFALGKTVGESNIPYEITTTIRIGPYDPVYHTNNRESIFTFTEEMYDRMTNAYKTNREAVTFISGYDASDIAAIKLAGNSPSLWTISPPDRDRLLFDLRNGTTLTARFMYTLTRLSPAKGRSTSASSEITLQINSTFQDRETLIKMIEGDGSDLEVTLPNLVPKFLKLPNSGDVRIVSTLMPSNDLYRPLTLEIHGDELGKLWWEIRDYCSDIFYLNTLKDLPLNSCDSGIVMYVFNEKKFPSTLGWFTATGILGLYTTFVLVASRFLKGFISGQNRKIMFEDLPYVDRVLQLCLDIYLVREALEFALEEDLFAKLIFLYRSPETLIKWTRPKEEFVDDETDTESVPSRSSTRRLPELQQQQQQQQQQRQQQQQQQE